MTLSPRAASLLTVLVLAAGAPAHPSSDDAWEQFRADVEAACLEAAAPMFEAAKATVHPFGSQSYGLALVTGKAKAAEAQISAICVYDKKAKAVEIGGELPS